MKAKNNLNRKLWQQWGVVALFFLILTSCRLDNGQQFSAESGNGLPSFGPTLSSATDQHGRVVTIARPQGAHHLYLPITLAASPDVIVLAHGTPSKDESAVDVAGYYIENWIDLAEEQDVILIAPAFDDPNYSSKDGEQAMGGYRGLFGRNIGADEFVIELVDHYQDKYGSTDRKFYLYGHSAGGQFVARFIVKHPGRVKGAVITAAATYPQPNPDIPWPYGLAELRTTIQWPNPETKTVIDFAPNPDDWLTATTLPVTVIVGMNDFEWQPDRAGQKGNNRIAIARNWVQDMNRFAAQHGVAGNIKLSLIPNLGHSSIGLLPYSQAALRP
jgi:pimeloyl-ACP methyl ester carboxylesterase